MTVRNRSNAEHYTWGDACDGWRHLSRPDLSVIEERIPPNGGEVRHFHSRARQLFFVLSGTLHIETPSETAVLGASESFEVEPTMVHRVYNPADTDAVFLVISAPATAGDRTNVPAVGKEPRA